MNKIVYMNTAPTYSNMGVFRSYPLWRVVLSTIKIDEQIQLVRKSVNIHGIRVQIKNLLNVELVVVLFYIILSSIWCQKRHKNIERIFTRGCLLDYSAVDNWDRDKQTGENTQWNKALKQHETNHKTLWHVGGFVKTSSKILEVAIKWRSWHKWAHECRLSTCESERQFGHWL